MDAERPLVICLMGPTAAGKTDVALELVRQFPCDIISVDSAMIYRGMNIGTAKPAGEVLKCAPHRLIDIRDPWESYSAGDFCADAGQCIEDITSNRRIPLLVGGTLLYFRALQNGLAPLPPADPSLRAVLDEQAAEIGWPGMHAQLLRVDPEAAGRIEPNDRQRIQRALEVYRLTGETISSLQAAAVPESPFRFLSVALLPSDRELLYARIEARFARMMTEGFIDELEYLRSLPRMQTGCSAMRAVGYRQLWEYLDGEVPLEEAQRRAIVATRRFAKRQLTWLRTEPADLEFDCLHPGVAQTVAEALHHRMV